MRAEAGGMLGRFLLSGVVVPGVLLLAGCRGGPEGEARTAAGEPAEGVGVEPELETVARGLDTPWALAFAPDGRIFVTERPGRIRVIEQGTLRPEPWATLDVAEVGEAGLMGIALAPDFATSGNVYVVATFQAGGRLVNRVLRLRDRGGVGGEPTVVIDGLPANRYHAGGGLAFGPDGMLYVTTGDAGDPPSSQDRGSLRGKVLRYRPDGTIPPDNPFPGSPVYALGLRNPQGLAWHPETGDLFATDHGPSGIPNEGFRRNHDELNAIRPGGNYGWPEVAGNEGDGAFIPPLADWTPSIAPNGVAIYSGAEAAWRGNAFVGGLRGEQLRRVVLERAPGTPTGWRVAHEEVVFRELGRIRAVAMGPDGHLYFTTSNRDGRGNPAPEDDRVFRVVFGR